MCSNFLNLFADFLFMQNWKIMVKIDHVLEEKKKIYVTERYKTLLHDTHLTHSIIAIMLHLGQFDTHALRL